MMNRSRSVPLFEACESRQLLAVLPTISLSSDPELREGEGTISVRVRRTGAINRTVTVSLTWSGSAKAKDLKGEPGTVTIPGGKKIVYVHISAPDEGVAESTETAIVTLNANKKYRVASGGGRTSFLVHNAVANPNPNPDPDPDPDPNPNPDPDPHPVHSIDWSRISDAPISRAEPESAVVDGKFYTFSGYFDDSWVPSHRVDRYDPATNQWTQLADMPVGVTHAATTVVGTNIWFAGGYAERIGFPGLQDIAITTVYIYDTLNNTWSTGPSLPEQRGSGGMGLIDNKLYFTSGERRDRSNVSDTWMLDLGNQSAGWQSRAPIPEGRTHFGTSVINNEMYVLGGQLGFGENASTVKSAYKYSPASNTWTRLADLPTATSHYSPATIHRGGKIYLFGGEEIVNQNTDKVFEYDTATNVYRTITSMPVARAAAAVGLIGDKVYFTGGKSWGWQRDAYVGVLS